MSYGAIRNEHRITGDTTRIKRMNKRGGAGTWIILLAIAFIAYQYVYLPSQHPTVQPPTQDGNLTASSGQSAFTLAFWNLQVFGTDKANDPEKLDQYAKVLQNYDIVAVEEIRDVTGQAWNTLCERMSRLNYSCAIGDREGSTASKEQYGLIYRVGQVLRTRHVSAAEAELNQLKITAANLASGGTKVILGGDFNSDCSYYKTPFHSLPDGYTLQISDDLDTTSGASNCAYDRVLTTDNIMITGSGTTSTGCCWNVDI